MSGFIITSDTIITIGAVLAAIIAIFGVIFAVFKWYLRQEQQDKEIGRIKEENTLICYGLSACLDGLLQLGANHIVSDAKIKLDKYLNQQAHN